MTKQSTTVFSCGLLAAFVTRGRMSKMRINTSLNIQYQYWFMSILEATNRHILIPNANLRSTNALNHMRSPKKNHKLNQNSPDISCIIIPMPSSIHHKAEHHIHSFFCPSAAAYISKLLCHKLIFIHSQKEIQNKQQQQRHQIRIKYL